MIADDPNAWNVYEATRIFRASSGDRDDAHVRGSGQVRENLARVVRESRVFGTRRDRCKRSVYVEQQNERRTAEPLPDRGSERERRGRERVRQAPVGAGSP